LYKTTATDERKIYDNFLVDRLVLKTMAAASPKGQIRRQSRISNALRTTRSTWFKRWQVNILVFMSVPLLCDKLGT